MNRCRVCGEPAQVDLRLQALWQGERAMRVWYFCRRHARAMIPEIDRGINPVADRYWAEQDYPPVKVAGR